ncbi:DUF7504 family protein [Halorubrum halodurans]|uniref:Recombinase RecA n=1 Tax=Halorubrum halodurans TaxID=1383851 RepID=A0A256IK37_9EURY|nr:hypothetical protein [Halorubrum halodurans]OYR56517.1 hypothetical protein DJ70_08775 [Halorubrum halodurans]
MNTLAADCDTVLVAGPTLSGRRRLLHRTLYDRAGGSLLVATRQPADDARETHRRLRPDDAPDDADGGSADGDSPVVVDCVTNAFEHSTDDTRRTRYAQHPSNLTSIGTTFTEVIEAREEQSLAVGIETVSPLLVYADTTDVYRFLDLVVRQATDVGWPVTAGIDTAAHDDRTVEQFVTLFDAVVRTRYVDGERQYRLQRPERTDWRPVYPEVGDAEPER